MKLLSMRGLHLKALFIGILILQACSLLRVNDDARKELRKELSTEKPQEISNHLEFLGQDYLNIIGKNGVVKLHDSARRYLNEMHARIVRNNELVFTKYTEPKFYIVSDATPFHFSLPGGNYFFSTGLIKKYLANEDLLAAVMAIEVLRSEKGLYEMRAVVPVGSIGTEKMLSILRLPISTRGEINKWSYLLMKRAGYDPGALLNLIQLKNKNALDFSSSVGNISTISREEFNYKNFLSRTPVENSQAVVEKNSARGFYILRSDVSRESE